MLGDEVDVSEADVDVEGVDVADVEVFEDEVDVEDVRLVDDVEGRCRYGTTAA